MPFSHRATSRAAKPSKNSRFLLRALAAWKYFRPRDPSRTWCCWGIGRLIAGAPVPLFKNLGSGFRFVGLPKDESLENRKTFTRTIYPWATETETYSVPSVLMGRDSNDKPYAANIQRLVLSVLSNQQQLKTSGHGKWNYSAINMPLRYFGYDPANDAITLLWQLESLGFKIYRPQ
jgi:hypothetical protein